MSAEAVEAECIRRWFSVNPACTCPPCVRTAQRRRKHREAGIIVRTSSEEAWAVIDQMLAAGWTPRAIATACNLTDRGVQSILYDALPHRRRLIGAGIAERIVNHGAPTRGYVGCVGSRRKIRALNYLGHPVRVIANASGVHYRTIHQIRDGKHARITPANVEKIDHAFRLLSMTPGSSPLARLVADRHGWAPPLAWDNIDDPAEKPQGMDAVARPRKRHEAMRQMAGEGVSVQEIAAEFDCHPRTVIRAIAKGEKS